MAALRFALLMALCTFAAYALNHTLGFTSGASAWAFWLPNGVALAFLLRRPEREWALLLFAFVAGKQAASIALDGLWWGAPQYQGALANVLEVLVAAILMLRLIHRLNEIPSVGEILGFIALAVIAAPLPAALLAAEGFARSSGGEFWTITRTFYVGDSLGILVATPLILVWWRPRELLRVPMTGGLGEGLALVTATFVLGFLIFFHPLHLPGVKPLPYLVVPLVMWGVARFGMRGGCTQVAGIAILSVALTARGYGPFATTSDDPNFRVLALQLFLGVLAGSSLLLGSLVAQRARLQERARKSQTLAALGELSARVAHDFNNDLTVIRGWAADVGDDDPRARREASAEIERAADRAGHLVGELLAFGGDDAEEPAVIAPAELVNALGPTLGQTLGGDHPLRLDIAGNAWPVRAEAYQLEVALINLTANGRDAMPDGGTLTVGVRNERPASGTEQVVLFVRDEGRGIPTDDLPRIFDPFFSTRRGSGGTGLGLTTVRRVAQRAGGDVRVESEPGQGTTFEIVLPRSGSDSSSR